MTSGDSMRGEKGGLTVGWVGVGGAKSSNRWSVWTTRLTGGKIYHGI